MGEAGTTRALRGTAARLERGMNPLASPLGPRPRHRGLTVPDQYMAMTLGIRALLHGMLDLAHRHFPNARTEERVNERGELVLAIIIPERTRDEGRALYDVRPERRKREER